MPNKKPKSFRFNVEDIKKLDKVHQYYKDEYEITVIGSNMNDLHKWTEAQTLAVLIRDKYEELKGKGEVE